MNSTKQIFIFDFDSTFIQVESLEILAQVALTNHPQKKERLATIQEITQKAMEGFFSFQESLQERFALLELTPAHIQQTQHILAQKISPSIARHQKFFQQRAADLYIISGAFIELVWPIVQPFGFFRNHVFANSLLYDFEGNIKGYDVYNLLAQDQGKVKLTQQLRLEGEIIMIGDGYTDYELKAAGLATHFVAFVENVERPTVVADADMVIPELEGLFVAFGIEP